MTPNNDAKLTNMKRDDVNDASCPNRQALEQWLGDWPDAYVLGQLGQSLDGRIATASGHSHYINAQSSRQFLHLLRARVDAVIIGVGTALADQPQLTTRHVDGTSPVRVIIDPNARINPDNPVFNDDGVSVIHVHHEDQASPVELDHVVALTVPRQKDSAPGLDLQALRDELSQRGLHRLLVEGGSTTISRFVEADMLDALYLMVAPLLIGSGPSGIALPPIETLDEAKRHRMRSLQWGEELLIEFGFR